jgi:translation elongation factor EF-1alpha
MSEREVGVVSHYFGKVDVAGIDLTGDLAVGDTIRISGHTTEFTQTVDSMQIDHASVDTAGPGDQIGIKVADRVREGDTVYKVT